MAGVRHVLYKRCVQGDRRKVQAQSNDNPTEGGGARDLRFNPWVEFEPAVAAMFTNVEALSDGRKVYSAPVFWFEGGSRRGPTTVKFWSPTKSRGGEGRLSRVHEVTPFDENHLPAETDDPFFLLWTDTNGVVWAKYVTVPELQQPGWSKKVADPILNSVRTKPATTNIRGWVDVRTGNGKHFDAR